MSDYDSKKKSKKSSGDSCNAVDGITDSDSGRKNPRKMEKGPCLIQKIVKVKPIRMKRKWRKERRKRKNTYTRLIPKILQVVPTRPILTDRKKIRGAKGAMNRTPKKNDGPRKKRRRVGPAVNQIPKKKDGPRKERRCVRRAVSRIPQKKDGPRKKRRGSNLSAISPFTVVETSSTQQKIRR